MTKLLNNDLALFLFLNTVVSGAITLVAAPYAWRPSSPDFEALHIWRNITFPFAALMVFSHVAAGFHRPVWRWLWYGGALLNYLAYSLFGKINVPWALWYAARESLLLWQGSVG